MFAFCNILGSSANIHINFEIFRLLGEVIIIIEITVNFKNLQGMINQNAYMIQNLKSLVLTCLQLTAWNFNCNQN